MSEVLAVVHIRYFIERLADEVWWVEDRELQSGSLRRRDARQAMPVSNLGEGMALAWQAKRPSAHGPFVIQGDAGI